MINACTRRFRLAAVLAIAALSGDLTWPTLAVSGPIGLAPPIGTPPPVVKTVILDPMSDLGVSGGEVQSTVVAPGLKKQCPAGRILATNDYELRSGVESQYWGTSPLGGPVSQWLSSSHIVNGADLFYSAGGSQSYQSVVEAPYPGDPKKRANRYHAGQDHDLVALPDGAVLLVALGESDASEHTPYPDAAHDWWQWSYTGDGSTYINRGPGVRTVMYVWRSEDCGQTFRWVTEIDPSLSPVRPTMALSSGDCAMPQVGRVPPLYVKPDNSYMHVDGTGKNVYDTAQTPGAKFLGYNQGGSDGPLTRVDPRTGEVFLTFGCVGNYVSNSLALNTGRPYNLGSAINTTIVQYHHRL
jgi:hypothetical protein